MRRLKLVFGTVNTVPVGTSDQELERIYQNAYKPFLGALYNQPDFQCTLYYSGTLLSWLDRFHPEYVDALSEIVARRQVEILGGAFYDPILSMIPRSDRVGQIESLTTLIRKRLGRKPRGFWIPFGEWDPAIPLTLRTSSFDYTFLDESHFYASGVKDEKRLRPVVSEDQGKTITVLPVNRSLARRMPGEPLDTLISAMRTLAQSGDERLAVLMVDGRTLGDDAESNTICYGGRWLENLFSRVLAEPWLETIQPGRYLKLKPAEDRLFFHYGTFDNSALHALEPERQKQLLDFQAKAGEKARERAFVCAVFFKQFFSRYHESNLLYCKMQYIHILVNQIRRDKYRKHSAREELWKGQCNAAYWYGHDGALYDHRIRKAAYASLIGAEKVTREKGVFISSVVNYDLDLDGRDEYLYQGNEYNAYVHARGAQLFELDHLASCWNYLDTLQRRRESCHGKDVEGWGFDRGSRAAFIDRFPDPHISAAAFAGSSYEDRGDFALAEYSLVKCDREHSELVLQRTGSVGTPVGSMELSVLKKFIFRRSSINLYYTVTNLGDKAFRGAFACELNFSFAGRQADSLRLYSLDGSHKNEYETGVVELPRISELLYDDLANSTCLTLSSLEPARLLSAPVETLVLGRGGMRGDYQATGSLLVWQLNLESQAAWENRISLRFD